MFKIIVLLFMLVSQGLAYSMFESERAINERHFKLIHAIKDIVISTQKTRGLTNNYMNGNVVAQLLVYGQRKQMLDNFNMINKSFKELELSSQYYKDASRLMMHSKLLNKSAFKSDSSKVFVSYSSIIEKWIELNAEVIKTRFLEADERLYKDLNFLNQVLLPLSENIGKMRGLGSGLVAKGYCNKNEAKKMKGFVTEIRRYAMLLEYHMSTRQYSSIGLEESKSINKSIKDYMKLTKDKVIGQYEIQLVTNEYFNQGTDTISNILKIYNVISSTL